MMQAMPELLSQLKQHGISVAAAGPNIEVTIQKGKPDPRARLLLDQLKARKAEALRLLSGQPEPKPFEMPANLEARAAELQAQLTGHFDETPATAKAVYELNIILEMMSEPGCQTSDVFGKPWKELYLEAQQ